MAFTLPRLTASFHAILAACHYEHLPVFKKVENRLLRSDCLKAAVMITANPNLWTVNSKARPKYARKKVNLLVEQYKKIQIATISRIYENKMKKRESFEQEVRAVTIFFLNVL